MGRRNKKSSKHNTMVSTDKSDENKINMNSILTESNINCTETDKITITSENHVTNEETYNKIEGIDKKNNNHKRHSICKPATDIDTEMLIELKLTSGKTHVKPEMCNPTTKFRDFYINYLCQVCKNPVCENECCTKCHMISYCSSEHRRKHWPIHADICSAIQEICKTTNKTHILEDVSMNCNAEIFKSFCYNLMLECKKRVQRTLEEWEVELFIYPKVCETCYNWHSEDLAYCTECHHTTYCKNQTQHLHSDHKNYCNSLILYRTILKYQYENGPIKILFSNTYSEKDILLENKNITEILKQSKTDLSKLEFVQLTEYATGPLTAAYSIQLFHRKNNTSITESLTIHVIGAEKHFELSLLQKWETYFLHYFNKLKIFNIIFIGPEMNLNNEEMKQLKDIDLCENCTRLNRKINFQFYDKMFYHNYLTLPNYRKPNLICAFNAGLYRTTGYNENDTWPKTITAMFKEKKVPVLVTAYTSVEMLKDIKRITELQKCEVIKMPSQNPFSSLKPNLNFVSYEETPLIFKNYYYILLVN